MDVSSSIQGSIYLARGMIDLRGDVPRACVWSVPPGGVVLSAGRVWDDASSTVWSAVSVGQGHRQPTTSSMGRRRRRRRQERKGKSPPQSPAKTANKQTTICNLLWAEQ